MGVGFAGYRKQDAISAAELGLAFLVDKYLTEVLEESLIELNRTILDKSNVNDDNKEKDRSKQKTPLACSDEDDDLLSGRISPIHHVEEGDILFSSRILDTSLEGSNVDNSRIRKGIPNLKKRTESKINELKKKIEDVVSALTRLENQMNRNPNNDIGKLKYWMSCMKIND